MASYVFETISAAEAAGYVAADSLTFSSAGAAGNVVSVAYLTDQVMVTLAGRSVTFSSAIMLESGMSFPGGSVLRIGGLSADALAGGDQADGLYGGQGNDTLTGGAGADLLQGNQGADNLNGGAGDDVVYGGQGDDTILLEDGRNFGQGNLGNDTVSAVGGTNILLGGQGDDHVLGGSGADFLLGNLGADSVSGGAGNDTLGGEGGADSLSGGAGEDRFVFAAGASDVTLAGADRIFDWSSADTIDGPGAGGSEYYMIPAGADGYDYDYGYGDGYGGGGSSGGGAATLTFAQALTQANSWMAGHPEHRIVTALVTDGGVAVFFDSDGDRAADLSVLLVGADLAALTAADFV